MPLNGQQKPPDLSNFRRIGDCVVRGNRDETIIPNGKGVEILISAFDSESQDIYVSFQECGQKYSHPKLKEFFHSKVDKFLEVRQCSFFPNRLLKAAADFDDRDKELDEESAAADLCYENEINCEWLDLKKDECAGKYTIEAI